VWQRTFLIVAGICELALLVPGAIFGAALGYHSFVAGEMGTMVGMLLLAVLVPLLPYGVMRIFALVGVWKKRRWGAILSIILSVLAAIGGLIVAIDTPGVLAVILAYAILSAWAALGCMKHPSFGGRTP
jgi:hypothetical protein